MKIANSLLLAAVGGVIAGTAGCGSDMKPAGEPGMSNMSGSQAMPMAKHGCKGQNECKNQGGCKTNANGCKGQNECKAKGGCKTS